MTIYSYLGLLFLAAVCWVAYKRLLKTRRARLLNKPLKAEWIEILASNVAVYNRLPAQLKNKLHGCVNLFLHEKVFVGCNGLAVTDEMRITIAGNACLLILHNNTLQRHKKTFPGFQSILVYPEAYVAIKTQYDGLITTHSNQSRAGESWHRGPIVLSWQDIITGSKNHVDGHNVVLHEFAHKLDEENGIVDGLPILREKTHYREWADVLTEEFEQFLKRVERGQNKVIDEYGAVSAPEFFAVATESFFEKPKQMKQKIPALYKQLEQFYGVDPVGWKQS